MNKNLIFSLILVEFETHTLWCKDMVNQRTLHITLLKWDVFLQYFLKEQRASYPFLSHPVLYTHTSPHSRPPLHHTALSLHIACVLLSLSLKIFPLPPLQCSLSTLEVLQVKHTNLNMQFQDVHMSENMWHRPRIPHSV